MLANGIKLKYKSGVATEFKELTGLKEVPEMGVEPEKVENTCLSDEVKQYEYGIGDPGDMAFKFKYENKSANSSYRILRGLSDSKTVASFNLEYPDGTTFEWDAQVSVKISGGGVNAPIEFDANMALQSEIAVTDPA